MGHIHVIITGRLQGVGFRMKAQQMAKKLGLRGFVQNLSDGSVEIYAEARSECLDQFMKLLTDYFLLHIVGIEPAKVLPLGFFHDFHIL
ncbi:MAG: acylphosphatase [Chlamydiia bacterium]